MSKKREIYLLKVGETGRSQLEGLDYVFGNESRRFLKDIGLERGMHVADIGCGSGNISCWMAEQVGPEGQVTAIDSNEAQLDIAREQAESFGLSNISFEQASIYSLETFSEQFDLVYERYVLTHLHEPERGMQSMLSTVKQGGVVAFEEGDVRTREVYPEFETDRLVFAWSRKMLGKSGCDLDISMKLFTLLSRMPDVKAQVRFFWACGY